MRPHFYDVSSAKGIFLTAALSAIACRSPADGPAKSEAPAFVSTVAPVETVAVPASPSVPVESPKAQTAEACASETLAALDAKDMQRFAALVHPKKGVRFTPYAFVDVKTDVVLSTNEIVAGDKIRVWGNFGESDEPIRMTFEKYVKRFVYDAKYAALSPAAAGTNDRYESAGWNLESLRQTLGAAYPDGVVVEYRNPPGRDEMGWTVLRLVCERHEEAFFLVGVVHSELTP